MFTRFMQNQGIQLALSQIDVIVKPEPVRRVLNRLYRETFPRYANVEAKRIQDEYRAELTEQKAFGTPNAFWLELVQEFMRTDGATKVVEITETTREFIRRTINRELENGASIDEIAKALISSQISVSRGRLIARTELSNSLNKGGLAAANRSGLVMQKVWISARDNRTRRVPRDKYDHLDAEGQTVGMNEAFNISGELLIHPGDPRGSAGNIINCRCSVGTEAVRDAAGRLQRIPVNNIPRSISVIMPSRSNITSVVTI